MPKDLLLIGGHDSSGCAGLAADTRVATAFGLSHSILPTLDSEQGESTFSSSQATEPAHFKKQLENALKLKPKVIKIGALADERIVETTDQLLVTFPGHIVIDPVFSSTSGGQLLSPTGRQLLQKSLLKRATVITPNLSELEELLGERFEENEETIRSSAEKLSTDCEAYVFLKGGHRTENPNQDLLSYKEFCLDIIFAKLEIGAGFRGTGCHLASAVAARLAKGDSPATAILEARKWFQELLLQNLAAGNSQLEIQ